MWIISIRLIGTIFLLCLVKLLTHYYYYYSYTFTFDLSFPMHFISHVKTIGRVFCIRYNVSAFTSLYTKSFSSTRLSNTSAYYFIRVHSNYEWNVGFDGLCIIRNLRI